MRGRAGDDRSLQSGYCWQVNFILSTMAKTGGGCEGNRGLNYLTLRNSRPPIIFHFSVTIISPNSTTIPVNDELKFSVTECWRICHFLLRHHKLFVKSLKLDVHLKK